MNLLGEVDHGGGDIQSFGLEALLEKMGDKAATAATSDIKRCGALGEKLDGSIELIEAVGGVLVLGLPPLGDAIVAIGGVTGMHGVRVCCLR